MLTPGRLNVRPARNGKSGKPNEPEMERKPLVSGWTPIRSTASSGTYAESLIWFFIQTKEGNDKGIAEYRRFIEKTVMPRLEAVPGVASAQVFWVDGAEELQIIFDPHKAASLGIDLTDVAARAGRANDVSGGFA